ncbi:MAG: zinc-dependent peptidase [Ectothiorhodospiraceae bacterium]|nr:zinc-dependent peptidase [Ectothiorhodospiraceae bacterium]
MFNALRNWRRARTLQRQPIDDDAWNAVVRSLPLLRGLQPDESAHLRELATLFLAEKRFFGAHGFEVTDRMRLSIAAQACLPILGLGIDWYRGWSSIIVYPDDFLPRHEDVDEAGVVHEDDRIYSGESWELGPVVLSWAEIEAQTGSDEANLVIHELSHKLDLLNGQANGEPPLHRDMDPAAWAADLQAAYDDLCERTDHGEETVVDPYASTDPAEFFAVTSEYFFVAPDLLADSYPAVYRQLARFYRQDPRRRLPATIL